MMKRYIRAIGVWIGALSIGMAAIGCQVGVVESQQLTAKAVKSFENGHFETATSTLQQALDRDPNNGDALYWLARIDMKYQDYRAAQLKLQSALGIAPDNLMYSSALIEAHQRYGERLAREGDFDAAIGAFGSCARAAKDHVDRDRYDAEAHLNRARCLRQARDYRAAAQAYEMAIRANPFLKDDMGTTVHYKELAELYKSFGFFDSAIRVLNNGLLNNIDDGMLEITLADVLRAKGNFAESLAHYERAEKYLTDKDKSILRAIPAMYGAGMASYGLARHEESSKNLRESGDLFTKSREWLNKYIESSHSSEERLRRASAVQWIKIIDRKLEKDAIGNDIEEGE